MEDRISSFDSYLLKKGARTREEKKEEMGFFFSNGFPVDFKPRPKLRSRSERNIQTTTTTTKIELLCICYDVVKLLFDAYPTDVAFCILFSA